jgi:hypothetical protein
MLRCYCPQEFHDRLKAEQDILESYDTEESVAYIQVIMRLLPCIHPPQAVLRHSATTLLLPVSACFTIQGVMLYNGPVSALCLQIC